MTSRTTNRPLFSIVLLASILALHLLYRIPLQYQASQEALLSVSQRYSKLQSGLDAITELENSILKNLKPFQGADPYTIASTPFDAIQEQLQEALKSLTAKDEQLGRILEEQQRVTQQLKDQNNKQPSETDRKAKTHRIWDVILLREEYELDFLETRLNDLYLVVDFFVIIEPEFTTLDKGKETLFYSRAEEQRFRPFRNKILLIVVPPPAPGTEEEIQRLYPEKTKDWELAAAYARDEGLRLAIQIRKPGDADWVMMSDPDEIPRAEFIQELKHPDLTTEVGRQLSDVTPETVGDLFRIRCTFYYYSFESRAPHGWIGPVLMRYRDEDSEIYERVRDNTYRDISMAESFRQNQWARAGQQMRDERLPEIGSLGSLDLIENQCVHCQDCFSTLQQFYEKMNRVYSKEPFYWAEMHNNSKWILNHVRSGVDIFRRRFEISEEIWFNGDVPPFIQQNPGRFPYLVQRHGLSNAGCTDVPTDTPLYDKADPLVKGPVRHARIWNKMGGRDSLTRTITAMNRQT